MQILADAWKVMDDGDVLFLQMRRGADAGEHQQLGRADGAGGHDHFARGIDALRATALDDLDAHGLALLDQNAGDEDSGS